MSVLNPNIPSPELSRLLTNAAAKRRDYRLQFLTPQLLLRAILDEPTAAAYQILQKLAQQRGFKLDELRGRVETMTRHAPGKDAQFTFTDDFGQPVPLAEEMLFVIDEGLTLAKSRDELKVSSGHALAAMLDPRITTYGVLQRLGLTQAAVIASLAAVAETGAPVIFDFISEAKAGKAQPVYQREKLLQELLSLLALSGKRHIILVGEEGVGKRTLIYSLALLLAENKGGNTLRSVVQMNESALLENPLEAIRVALRRASGGLLLVPGLERFFGDRLRMKFPQQVSNELHKALLGTEQVIIGTTDPINYEKLAQDPLIRQNTHRLVIPPTTVDETRAILATHRQRLEQEYEVEMTQDGLSAAASLAHQYIKTTPLPASALQLADRACALVRMVRQEHLANLPQVSSDGRVDKDDVTAAASLITQIPITKLGEEEQSKYANMVERLHERIIGQQEAILAVSRAVKTARVGLRDPKRPIGSFLFLGPSGVGKSELAKALAEFMFGTENAMLTLDMSEYQEEASVNRLIGPPPGYVGFEGGGQLTNFVRERPYTVVLFDEVEKAHEKIFDVLLQLLDEGRLTDGQGRLTTFSETVIIMTSNLGSRHMLVPAIGEHERELVMAAVHSFFRPEFLNRLDDIIMFHQLNSEQLAVILDLLLKKEIKLAEQQGLLLTITPEARQWLLAQNNEPQYGARPLRRLIARHLREPLADFLLTQKRQEGAAAITITAQDGKLSFALK
ncbi:MAG: ATP-dependent Clp protease ATP-binding subunit [Chloroflexi bacterium]|nr:ATP-dependent Clp protease ATP-binding subunit [Chloroflexota bacterium]MBP8054919.1 ATP-dependent Clp protease ATP-binding subunit [Chloroflexota bacterium]